MFTFLIINLLGEEEKEMINQTCFTNISLVCAELLSPLVMGLQNSYTIEKVRISVIFKLKKVSK